MTEGGTHPHPAYWGCLVYPMGTLPEIREGGQGALIGDEVAAAGTTGEPLGVVTDIHGESFGDGVGDTITVLPAAVTLSTGDRYPVADLVLLRRADS